ncbi:polyprenyl synthetase [Veronia nyctiphanis]|uniref:Polyprenyl synthetase n=1 Tax=Veronia nyctiphanis TaxID=1278244 RepID=A0A4Q0YSN7_9GAMM|nr:polyprenyl synthetase family protein [Veronia nyctiphanis]RXJ72119.1 polyprenyl synthetase [Veronia nyctiphanis]
MTQDLYPVDDILADVEALMHDSIRGSESLLSAATEACLYHLKTGGKRNRARLAIHCGQALNLTKSSQVAAAAVAELLHNASLIHDDLQDHDDTRRGNETVWKKYGADVALCAGDIMISASYAALLHADCRGLLPQCVTLIHRSVCKSIQGQCHDLSYTRYESYTLLDYEKMAEGKSGPLLSLPVELVYQMSGHQSQIEQVREAVYKFAVAYQITDDINDVDQDLRRGETGAAAPNAVIVLRDNGHGEKSDSVASLRVFTLLDEVKRDISTLPGQLSEIFNTYILGLRASLSEDKA